MFLVSRSFSSAQGANESVPLNPFKRFLPSQKSTDSLLNFHRAVIRMLISIGSPKNVPAFIEKVKRKEVVLSGFGHRIYKVRALHVRRATINC